MFCCSFISICSNHSMWPFVAIYVTKVHGDIPPSLMVLFFDDFPIVKHCRRSDFLTKQREGTNSARFVTYRHFRVQSCVLVPSMENQEEPHGPQTRRATKALAEAKKAGHGKKKLSCNYTKCTSVFTTFGSLSSHTRTVHLKQKPIICQERGCDKKFRDKSKLKDHLRSAHGAPKLPCKHSNCNATFVHSGELSKHMKKIH